MEGKLTATWQTVAIVAIISGLFVAMCLIDHTVIRTVLALLGSLAGFGAAQSQPMFQRVAAPPEKGGPS